MVIISIAVESRHITLFKAGVFSNIFYSDACNYTHELTAVSLKMVIDTHIQ